ncbi:MAG: TatD family hydrolase [Gammaproteobacteria bacterium]
MISPIVDIGANLTHDSFAADRVDVIRRAQAAGVTRLIVTGSDVAQSRKALALAHEWPGVLYATAGVHPHQAAGFEATTPQALRALLAEPEVVAAGECGLDYFRNYSPRAAQLRAFEAQLALAAEIGKPVFLHQREAHAEFVSLLKDWGAKLAGAVVHCFTESAIELRAYLDLDCHIGITGWICDERRGLHLRELVKLIPADRLLLETDAPYLLPRDLRPQPRNRHNEPMYLPHICTTIADCIGQTPQQLAAQTSANAQRLFRLRDT